MTVTPSKQARPPESLYVPRAFAEHDPGRLHDLIEAHSFALLVAAGEDAVPVLAHLPFVLDRERGPHGTLRAHVARANPMRAAIERGAAMVAVFTGPHAYVSPGWYASRDDVPTWNYAVVHAHGTPRGLDTAGLRAVLARLSEIHERGQPQPWSPDELAPEKLDDMLPAIFGFELPIERIEGKFKLSQNRRPEDREGTVRGLAARGTPDDRALVALMVRGQGGVR